MLLKIAGLQETLHISKTVVVATISASKTICSYHPKYNHKRLVWRKCTSLSSPEVPNTLFCNKQALVSWNDHDICTIYCIKNNSADIRPLVYVDAALISRLLAFQICYSNSYLVCWCSTSPTLRDATRYRTYRINKVESLFSTHFLSTRIGSCLSQPSTGNSSRHPAHWE